MERKNCFMYIWMSSRVKPSPTTIRNHSQNWRKSCDPLPIPCGCHKWMTPHLNCNRTLQFSNFWLKILRLTKKHQIKWYCQGRRKTLLSRNILFQLANFFKLDIYLTFVNSLWKKWTGRIVSLVILIGCVTFPSLFPDVIRMSLSTGSFLVHLHSRIFWIPKEYYFPLICMT